jgi:excinuclease ABC subunit A
VAEPTHISVRGARAHNLVGVDVDVPRNALVVFTGVSGSGKSSLAYDTIYKEGQRRFMESLSAYARQFLGDMARPEVESVEGVSPTLSIDQKTVNRNPRSTVGTVTEIYDHLRLLMARLGTPRCPLCASEIAKVSTEQLVDRLLTEAHGERASVLGPLIRARKGEYRKEFAELARDGWVRARVDGAVIDLSDPPVLARYEKHTIEVVVDRLRIDRADRARLTEAIETAVRIGAGSTTLLFADREDGDTDVTYSTERGCPDHPEVAIPELEPRLFSFNAPQGACQTCNGIGIIAQFDRDLLVDQSQKVATCFQAFNSEGRLPFAHFDRVALKAVAKRLGAPLKKKVASWPEDVRVRLLEGDPEISYTTRVDRHGRRDVREHPWRGLIPLVQRVWKYTSFGPLERFRVKRSCEDCGGHRLNPIALAVDFRGHNISWFSEMTVATAHAFFENLSLSSRERKIGEPLIREIRERIGFLHDVGLDYLTLNRTASTLSGGEAQRIRLAAQVGSALQGVTYVLDEPSIGLHPRDNLRLLSALRRLRDRGNSVLVVEHDAETIEAADFVIDVGPGAGREGGRVVAAGTPKQLMRSKKSLTAQYLRGERTIPMPQRRSWSQTLGIRGAVANNLRQVDVDIPLSALSVVTGVSGSGKSSLVFGVVEASLRALAKGESAVLCKAVIGAEQIDKIVRISQTPIGRTPRSNPATYSKAFDPIRALFASTPEARARGYKKGRFSFNVAGGRCEACQGAGVKTVEMQFLPSVLVECEICRGRRFNAETLEITWRGRTIHDVLQMTVEEACGLFESHRKLARILGTLVEVGLGYVPMGQPSTTLSGGEAQRVKLASELQRPSTGQTLYLLDEPTTGLHFLDVEKLLGALQRLVDGGNTVVVVEHHADVIKCADCVIDLGPEGGSGGGQIVGWGPPETLAALDTPTGRVLSALSEFEALHLGAAEPPAPRLATRRKRVRRADALVLKGARKNNLQDVDVVIPHGKLTVITGVSGSGKTSLAFDTIFAEGQRQYVESLSTYARRFLGRVERAPVEEIHGLQPAIAIDQKNAGRSARSTVATVTEIHDVLRILWARIGTPHCPSCGQVVQGVSPSVAARRLREHKGTGWIYTVLRPQSEGAEERCRGLLREGWTRLLSTESQVRQVSLEDPEAVGLLRAGAKLVIDRVNPARVARSRVAEALATAYQLGGGRAVFLGREDGYSEAFSLVPSCAEHGPILEGGLSPKHFSFNSQLGACEQCDGLGVSRGVRPERLFAHPHKIFWEALDPRVTKLLRRSARTSALVDTLLADIGAAARPVSDWSEAVSEAVLYGVDTLLTVKWSRSWGASVRRVEEELLWSGLVARVRPWTPQLEWLTDVAPCEGCGGGRLKRELLSVTIGGDSLHDFTRRTVEEAIAVVRSWSLDGEASAIAERPLFELQQRLRFLVDVGLGYLGLFRSANTLSGGEAQRIRLASQLGASLTGVTYVLDEPTVGLHPRDTDRLLTTLTGLRDLGNTVILVEHDPDAVLRADHVLDLGPGAGLHGGHVVASGPPSSLMRQASSLTGRWLSGVEQLPVRSQPRAPAGWMTLKAPSRNNLRCGDVCFPMGAWVAVAGVSGSGKSSLIIDSLVPALGSCLKGATGDGSLTVEGPSVNRLVVVNQAPIGRTPRSTPATYIGLMDHLRKLFASTTGAMERGWKPGRFSFNAPRGGRCQICEGRGSLLIEMHFLPDVWVVCEACRGLRYGAETLDVRWKGASIADVLAMRADRALEHFANIRSLRRPLQAMVDVGLGYLTLGQPATTLSGGEAQRVKLASELTSRRGHCVYVLDEPTTGLHLADVACLVDVLHRLVDAGHTVVTIEHHLDFISQADWLIELGPEGGDAGGRIVAEGSIDWVSTLETATGHCLANRRGRTSGFAG